MKGLRNGVVPVNGSELKRLRKLKGWTAERLAAEAQLSIGTVSRFENGEPAFLSTITAFAQALEVPHDSLFAERDVATTITITINLQLNINTTDNDAQLRIDNIKRLVLSLKALADSDERVSSTRASLRREQQYKFEGKNTKKHRLQREEEEKRSRGLYIPPTPARPPRGQVARVGSGIYVPQLVISLHFTNIWTRETINMWSSAVLTDSLYRDESITGIRITVEFDRLCTGVIKRRPRGDLGDHHSYLYADSIALQ